MNPSSIQRIDRLLREGRGSLADGAGPMRLVTGSPAADADCLAASVGYAFLLSLDAAPGTVKWLLNAARKRLQHLLRVGRSTG